MLEYKLPDYSIPYYEDNTRVSNSAIGWFLSKGPAYFRRMLDGKEPGLDLPQLRKGTMIHEYLLQPEIFWDDYQLFRGAKPKSTQAKNFCTAYLESTEIEPDKKLLYAYGLCYKTVGYREETVLNKAKELYAELKDYIEASQSKKMLISVFDLEQLEKIKENVTNHKLANELLKPAGQDGDIYRYHEFQINWEHGDIHCKSLLDGCIFDTKNKKFTIVDLKTTGSLWNFEHSMAKFDYYRQMMFYSIAVNWYLTYQGEDPDEWSWEVYIVGIDTTGSNEIRVFRLDKEALLDRCDTITKTLGSILWHIQNNKWEHTQEYYEGDGAETLPVITLYADE